MHLAAFHVGDGETAAFREKLRKSFIIKCGIAPNPRDEIYRLNIYDKMLGAFFSLCPNLAFTISYHFANNVSRK